MNTAEVELAYAPRGVGLAYAVVCVKKEPHLHGWWIGAQGADTHSAYFRLEDFYTAAGTTFYASSGSDLRGGWQIDLTSDHPQEIEPVAVDSELAQALERVQDNFAAEWLVFESDPDFARELESYREAELAHGAVNIRFRKLNKLDKQGALWRYYSRGFEAAVADYLGRRWPLDYGKT